MKRPLRRACAALAATIVAAAVACPAARAGETSRGGAFLPLGWDARGMSLGGAATVLVRGEESAYWNPANLSYIDGGGVSIGMVQLVEGLPSRYSTFSAGIGFGEAALDPDSSYRSHRFAMALSISQLGLELAGGSGWDETTLGLSAAYAFTSYSSVGLTIRGLKNKTDLADAGASGWAVDLGLTERITRRIWIGIAARDVASRIAWPERSESLDPRWSVAIAAVDLPGRVSVEFDVVLKRGALERVLAGAEMRVYENLLVLAGGLDTRLIDGERTIPSFGFGSSYGFVELFAGFSFDPLDAFGRRTRISLSLDF
jgi:hypothetical protein